VAVVGESSVRWEKEEELEEKDDNGGKEEKAVFPLEDDSGSGSAETETVESFDLVVVVVVVDDRDVPVDVATFPSDDSSVVLDEAPAEDPEEVTEVTPELPVSVAVAVVVVVEVVEPVETAVMGGNSKRSIETAAIACFRSCTVTVEPFRLWVR
jgi:hypothetical protein